MKIDFSKVIFMDKSRHLMDLMDRFYQIQRCLWLKEDIKEVSSVMIWAGIVDQTIIGQFKVNEGV